ncbi:hypothetical protein QVD17_06872 [Tagetes erecta]|uniref:Uncharacterized protein n=1 Tax=Tagetes erecta TaxID=13708 RepID=A0AAD8LL24_TARER|nr:hypothetical protein QVD17_06872 [Tagetes erecta]
MFRYNSLHKTYNEREFKGFKVVFLGYLDELEYGNLIWVDARQEQGQMRAESSGWFLDEITAMVERMKEMMKIYCSRDIGEDYAKSLHGTWLVNFSVILILEYQFLELRNFG